MNTEFDKLTLQGGISRFGDAANYIQIGPQGEFDVFGALAIANFQTVIRSYAAGGLTRLVTNRGDAWGFGATPATVGNGVTSNQRGYVLDGSEVNNILRQGFVMPSNYPVDKTIIKLGLVFLLDGNPVAGDTVGLEVKDMYGTKVDPGYANYGSTVADFDVSGGSEVKPVIWEFNLPVSLSGGGTFKIEPNSIGSFTILRNNNTGQVQPYAGDILYIGSYLDWT